MNPTAPPSRPSDVSGRIVGQHRAVRLQLDELSRVAKTVLTGGPAALKRALDLTRTLYDDLLKHIVLEGKILLPALRDADAWGKIRADTLIGRLRTRRQELRALHESCATAESKTLGREIDRFIDDRRADMAHAEREVLDPSVLRDDVLSIDSASG
jgi:iron-sulfur cluster repair protein YtfE (RIC family)